MERRDSVFAPQTHEIWEAKGRQLLCLYLTEIRFGPKTASRQHPSDYWMARVRAPPGKLGGRSTKNTSKSGLSDRNNTANALTMPHSVENHSSFSDRMPFTLIDVNGRITITNCWEPCDRTGTLAGTSERRFDLSQEFSEHFRARY